MAKDSLRPARAKLDAARLTARSVTAAQSGSVLLVTHGFGGGTARVVADRAAELRAQGLRPILLIGKAGRTEIEADGETYPNLSFTLPADRQALAELLAPTRPVAMEVHHPLGQDHSITALAADFAIPIDIFLHDYAWLCLRVTFVTGEGRFCGEADPATCVLCEQRFGRLIDDPIAPAALRQRSAALFQSARHVIVPHAESASRLRRHMPRISPIIRALEDDSRFPQIHRKPRGDTLTIAIIGALGAEKGYDVLLACARDAASRALPLQFVVVGYTIDDPTLLDTGRIFITGQFRPEEAAELIRRQGADLAFLPSIWPETWCFALGDAWDAGLAAAVFDIGAPAARVRETGRGWVLPLGLPAARVNEALLNLQPLVDRQVAQGLVHAHVTPAGEKTVLQDMS
jgi:glycosyltransferase involved in cell wall biosynthesis